MIARGEYIEVLIEKFADGGRSLARVDGFVVFVPWAAPGDRVRARVYKKKKGYAEAAIEEVLSPSALRVPPACAYFGSCGGCRWQHVEYQAQLDAKTESVHDALARVGQFADISVRPAIGSAKRYFYRNKMEFSFSANRWLTRAEIDSGGRFDTRFALGLHVPGHFDKVLDVHECHLQSTASAEMVNRIRDFVREQGWPPWNIRKHTGFLRHLVIRTGERTGDVMVNLVTNGFDAERMGEMAAFLQQDFPDVTTFVNTIHTGKAQTAVWRTDRNRVRSWRHSRPDRAAYVRDCAQFLFSDQYGPGRAVVRDGARFRRTATGGQGLRFVLRRRDYLHLCGGRRTLRDGRRTHRRSGQECARKRPDQWRGQLHLRAGRYGDRVRRRFRGAVRGGGCAARRSAAGGLHPKVVEQIGASGPDRFVYASCNPRTQARDLGLLRDAYRIEAAQPVDLFPHTPHIENVVKLRRKT